MHEAEARPQHQAAPAPALAPAPAIQEQVRVESPRVEAPRVEAPRVDPKEYLAPAGLQMVETSPTKSRPAEIEPEPQPLGRPRRERPRVAEEELVQIETKK